MDTDLDPARLLRAARERSGLSQRALARRAGTSQSVVARIELGRTSPTVPTLTRLLGAAGHRLEAHLVPAVPELVARARAFFESRSSEGIAAAFLFGSSARWEGHGESDVDIGVLLDRRVYPARADRSELRVRLGADLVGALGFNGVDLLVLDDAPPGLARTVVLDGTPLAIPRPDLEHAFRREVQLRWADLRPFLRRAARTKLAALRR